MSNALKIVPININIFTLEILSTNKESLTKELDNYLHKIQDIDTVPFIIDLQQLGDNAWDLDLKFILDLCKNNDIKIIGIRHNDPSYKIMAKKNDIAFSLYQKNKGNSITSKSHTNNKNNNQTIQNTATTMIIDKPIRTGQRIYAKQTDLVVIGVVNEGAEIIADGNIHVYGSLRGRAVAGASGDKKTFIFVKDMQAQLVSIAGIYRTFDNDLPPSLARKGVAVYLQQDKLIISAL